MKLRSLFGCRRRTSRPAGLLRSPRPGRDRPRLETLEDRLPPGDLLLGAVLGPALWGPSLSATDPGPPPALIPAGARPAAVGPRQPRTWRRAHRRAGRWRRSPGPRRRGPAAASPP